MKIAVVNTSKSRVNKNSEYYIYTIKGFVEERRSGKYATDVIDVFMTDDVLTSGKIIGNGSYDVVLFRAIYWNAEYIKEVIQKLTPMPKLVGIWGHDTFSHPEDYFKNKGLNFIIQDEPELSLYEVAAIAEENGDFSKAAGIIYKDDVLKRMVFGDNRVLDNLDMIPSPYLNNYIEIGPKSSVYWEVSRGCLFRCDFCVEMSHLSRVRFYSFDYLKKELEFFREKEVPHIIIGSPVFNVSHQHVKKILSMIREYLPESRIEIQIRPDILSKEEIEYLSEMNVYLNFGIQTFNRKILENMMTSLNIEKTIQNIRHINNYPALSFGIDLIAGLPKTTYDDFLSDLDQALSLWPININIYRLSIYPGTRIFNRMREFDYRMEGSYPYLTLESSTFSRREMEKVEEIANGVTTLYNEGRMVSILTIIAAGLEIKCSELIEKWVKWHKKNDFPSTENSDYNTLFESIIGYFSYICERYQKKKLFPLISDLLNHNHFYTNSLTHESEDILTYPYLIDLMDENSEIGVNKSVFLKRYSYNIEDIIDSGYIDIKKYSMEVEKENLYGVVYRIEGAVFTRTVSDEEGALFLYLMENGETSLKILAEKFSEIDVKEVVFSWCDEGVMYIKILCEIE